ncbi:hypothetical protein PUNSTDRAFT_41634 [Punctularia strigosozonata HHB-11173 SS5]|uniref:uncharacterized protein n=1 Tax=Punctularia strigosozonata (strain HHB-11173) TaxID=741275 RepID=UPI0004416434|nr:uncharacterized protein PUNSTDRAFT_41634 [Punctularia strigosozonata HHB-11173 SS5]EIN14406.1 hypothetical protein PUNSTDRAFT_41634 [Punctularia strigosozonata HHB-11173 SS5]
MSDTATLKRQLKIKSGAAKRLLKEHNSYRNEAEQLQLKRDKLIADGAEEWDVKNAGRLVEESNKMVVDTAHRLGSTVQELRELVVDAKKKTELAGDDDLLKAEDALEEASV